MTILVHAFNLKLYVSMPDILISYSLDVMYQVDVRLRHALQSLGVVRRHRKVKHICITKNMTINNVKMRE